jgi:hypothetical protein
LKKDDVLSVPSLQWRSRLQCREVGDGWVAGPVSRSVRAVGARCVGIPALDQPSPSWHLGQRDAATIRRDFRRRVARHHWVVDRRPKKFLVGLAASRQPDAGFRRLGFRRCHARGLAAARSPPYAASDAHAGGVPGAATRHRSLVSPRPLRPCCAHHIRILRASTYHDRCRAMVSVQAARYRS